MASATASRVRYASVELEREYLGRFFRGSLGCDRSFDYVRLAELKIGGLIRVFAAHLNIDRIEKRAASPIGVVRGEGRGFSRLPARQVKGSCAGQRSVGGADDDRIPGPRHFTQDLIDGRIIRNLDGRGRPDRAAVQRDIRARREDPAPARQIVRPGGCEPGLRIAAIVEPHQCFENGAGQ